MLAVADVSDRLGRFVCPLHAAHPERPRWAAMGLPACPKVGYRRPQYARAHLEAFHVREYAYLRARNGAATFKAIFEAVVSRA